MSESSSGIHYLKLSSLSKIYFKAANKLVELSLNGLMMEPKHEGSTPMPWDAGLSMKGSDLIISGYIDAGGPGSGSCICTIPKSKADIYYSAYYEEDPDVSEKDTEFMRRILSSFTK